MRIAIPCSDGRLDPHFGHCRQFALIDLDEPGQAIIARRNVEAPPHEPGKLPAWVAEQGATLVLAGGMGNRAIALFARHGVEVIVGAPEIDPEMAVHAYLAGEIGDGVNACDH